MKKVSLHELMGKSGGKDLSLNDLGEILGERMPKLEFTPVGKLRLTTALRNRFGDEYRNLPGISGILKQFDEEAKFRVKIEEMKMIRAKRK